MDLTILKKKLSSYKTDKGQLRGLSDELLLELLRAWEHWTGTQKQFARELGLYRQQIAPLMGKAKKILRSGAYVEPDFHEITHNVAPDLSLSTGSSCPIELLWESQKVIRFTTVQQLAEFLRLVA